MTPQEVFAHPIVRAIVAQRDGLANSNAVLIAEREELLKELAELRKA